LPLFRIQFPIEYKVLEEIEIAKEDIINSDLLIHLLKIRFEYNILNESTFAFGAAPQCRRPKF
jgi:hypothetical protein